MPLIIDCGIISPENANEYQQHAKTKEMPAWGLGVWHITTKSVRIVSNNSSFHHVGKFQCQYKFPPKLNFPKELQDMAFK